MTPPDSRPADDQGARPDSQHGPQPGPRPRPLPGIGSGPEDGAADRGLVVGGLALLLADEPPLRGDTAHIERLGRAVVQRRRRTRAAVAGLAVAACGAAVLAVAGPLGAGPAGGDRGGVAVGPAPSGSTGAVDPSGTGESSGDPGGPGTGIAPATGFPLSEAFAAVERALPGGVRVGDLPMDVAWRPGGPAGGTVPDAVASVEVPLVGPSGTARAQLTLAPACALTGAGPVLDAQAAAAVAASVCDAWAAVGRVDPLDVGPAPQTPPDPAA